jgi:hypothetical protein
MQLFLQNLIGGAADRQHLRADRAGLYDVYGIREADQLRAWRTL